MRTRVAVRDRDGRFGGAGLRVVLGPTCSGKTGRAVQLAKRSGAPVIAVDRIQVYEDLAITSGRPSDDELDGTVRTYLDRCVTTDRHVEMTAAEGLSRLRRLLADPPTEAILEGGSISLWRAFFAEHSSQQTVSEILLRRVANWERFASRVEQRILGLLSAQPRSMLDEVGATLIDPRSRRLVLGLLGIPELVQWCERRGIAPGALCGVTHDVQLCRSLAAHLTPAWVQHAQMQQAVFERLLWPYDVAIERLEDLDPASDAGAMR